MTAPRGLDRHPITTGGDNQRSLWATNQLGSRYKSWNIQVGVLVAVPVVRHRRCFIGHTARVMDTLGTVCYSLFLQWHCTLYVSFPEALMLQTIILAFCPGDDLQLQGLEPQDR